MRTVIAIKKENVEITDRGVTAVDLKQTIKSHSEIIKKIQALVPSYKTPSKVCLHYNQD